MRARRPSRLHYEYQNTFLTIAKIATNRSLDLCGKRPRKTVVTGKQKNLDRSRLKKHPSDPSAAADRTRYRGTSRFDLSSTSRAKPARPRRHRLFFASVSLEWKRIEKKKKRNEKNTRHEYVLHTSIRCTRYIWGSADRNGGRDEPAHLPRSSPHR